MTIEELVDEIVVDVPEAPIMAIRDAARWAQREFCDGTNVWHIDSPVTVVDGVGSYEGIADAEPVRVLSVSDGDRVLIPGTQYHQDDPQSLVFGIAVTNPVAVLVLRPSRGHDMPAPLIGHWREALIAGACHRLLRMPQPWREMELSEYHRRRFMSLTADALKTTALGYGKGGARVKLRRYH
ncbi:hypothetical protein [Salinicola peritrichatus]|uniref:hypothetical protein n=1 Tax=Salinicola peritrichatus TaxID=1267424 RepID=UPI000DA1DC54|nr:hypothetical protein [Salinicola peritrichatus]